MKAKRSNQAMLLLWTAMAALLSQNLFVPVICAQNFEEQKNYYPDPHARTPPTGSYNPPSHGSGGGHATPTPTPSHGTPSHGGGSYGGNPPANCGNPPSGGGGHHHSPSPGGGGGYYPSPPSTTPTPTPTTPTTPIPPITPTPPTIVSPPTTPVDPGTPSTPPGTIPTPPVPVTPPFTCVFWRNHPTMIWGLIGWWGTVGNAFGVPNAPGLGANMNLLQALSNTRADGLGRLYREGTAALLNSMAYSKFPYSTSQVRDRFMGALTSNNAAAAQAQLFKLANEGRALPKS